MATLGCLKPEQVLWVVRRQKMGNTAASRGALFSIRIRAVDPSGHYVEASINGAPFRKYYERDVMPWRVSKPEPKSSAFGLPNY